jgi:2-(1,2-epoxy-1,2-dihydrophenyl)acetyl-CoA isomerase
VDYQTLTYELVENVARITLNRPDVRNALNTQMRAEITHAVKAAGEAARAVVITGAGKSFCSGQDLGDRAKLDAMDLERTLRDEYVPMIRAVATSPVPTVAAVNGAAAGAGASLALAADIVIASEEAVFLQAFSRIGLMPDAGATWALPRNVGLARAMGAALLAEPVSARDAAAWGMIWEAVPEPEFEARWTSVAARLASGPTLAYRAIKESLRHSLENDFETQIALESREQGSLGKSRDFREGVVAFLDKRNAGFEGR